MRISKKILLFLISIAFVGIVVVLIGFNLPHRDISKMKADYVLTSDELVQEYLDNADLANDKYLAENGDSKILEVKGEIMKISRNLNNQTVVLLQSTDSPAGVSVTISDDHEPGRILAKGKTVTLKGVIRSGAGYDSDMEIYRNVVLDKAIVK